MKILLLTKFTEGNVIGEKEINISVAERIYYDDNREPECCCEIKPLGLTENAFRSKKKKL